MTRQIDKHASTRGLEVLGTIRYDPAVTHAQLDGVSVVELGNCNAADDIRRIWARLEPLLA